MPEKIPGFAKKVINFMIDKDYKRLRSIRRFLKNQMRSMERAQFEKQLELDQDLRDEVDLYRLVIQELKAGYPPAKE